ncbi:hypothetical protein [uncultured Nisaea sp.]|jgi:hypothetical protein|uniref:hypothetical protein n=1 Tax=uncultured Nisaea sp. TaxID=538215 RepID=UPI0030EC6005|tara:strand:+ start:2167 stop:2448 length:282 start_codon:yes stop_codon:yes gene_type:complete
MGRFKDKALQQDELRNQPAILADLARAGIDVFCWCHRCGHNAKLTTALLIPQLGPNFPVPEIGTRMRCSACASKDIATRPSWPARDQGLARSG